MGMLTPWFLGGLVALGVPIVIHLINRERKTVVEFPSLMFLQKVTYKSVRQQKIRHLLLFILRCLALILLVAAFARPFLERKRSAGPALTGAREIVVLIDRSYSMGFGDRWKRAQEAAKKTVTDLGSRERGADLPFANDPPASAEPPPPPRTPHPPPPRRQKDRTGRTTRGIGGVSFYSRSTPRHRQSRPPRTSDSTAPSTQPK